MDGKKSGTMSQNTCFLLYLIYLFIELLSHGLDAEILRVTSPCTLSTPQISKMSESHHPRSICNSGPHICSLMAMKIKARDHPGRKPSGSRLYYRLLQETGVMA